MPPSAHKIIITGTGRAGTTFLVQLLTELGLDTGYTPDSARRDCFQHCSAGLERDLEDPASPTIVKSPEFCETLPAILARGHVIIDHALVPVRALDDATRSRIRVGGDGHTPGGLVGTADVAQQKEVLAERFHRLMHTLVAHEIPHTLLLFPRFARDADYAYEKLGFLVNGISPDQFRTAFARVVRPELIHDFNRTATVADAGAPARDHAQAQQRKRWRRRARRWLAVGSLVTACAWILTTQLATRATSSVVNDHPLFAPSILAQEEAAIARAQRSFNRPQPRRSAADSLYLSKSVQRMLAGPPAPAPGALGEMPPPPAFSSTP